MRYIVQQKIANHFYTRSTHHKLKSAVRDAKRHFAYDRSCAVIVVDTRDNKVILQFYEENPPNWYRLEIWCNNVLSYESEDNHYHKVRFDMRVIVSNLIKNAEEVLDKNHQLARLSKTSLKIVATIFERGDALETTVRFVQIDREKLDWNLFGF